MSSTNGSHVLEVPAVEFRQGTSKRLYSFALDGKLLPQVAVVSRIQRDEDDQVAGYQRPEVNRHIRAIRDYIESEDPMIPNALVIAFDTRVRFTPSRDGASGVDYARSGTLSIPLDPEQPPGFIVDGQQRTAAVRDADVDTFPMPVVAFVTDSEDEQRTQFILVNSTKPLPVGLINELLPTTVGRLPVRLERRRAPALLLERLNLDPASPLYGLIRTVTVPGGVIKDNSILKMLDSSISDGALYEFRDPVTGEVESEPAMEVLGNFWSAVGDVFKDAWGRDVSTRRSRLVHGAGIAAMGLLMDSITQRRGASDYMTFRRDLEIVAPYCAWTSGEWVFDENDRRPWNAIQNISKDTEMLKNHLRRVYVTNAQF
jgi:DGQHR domain-containing protein